MSQMQYPHMLAELFETTQSRKWGIYDFEKTSN